MKCTAKKSTSQRRGASRIRCLLVIGGVALCLFAAEAVLAPGTAEARPRPAGRHKRSSFKANKTFGLGLMLGAPTGLSGKYFLSPSTALDFGVGTIYRYRDRRGVHLHVDHLWHPFNLAKTDPFELPLYFGIGGRLLYGDYCRRYDRGVCDLYYSDYTAIGARAPIGISFDFNKVPLDIFIELALVLDFVVDRPSDRSAVYFDVNGAVGIRYYFN